jgi:hypothetical protein
MILTGPDSTVRAFGVSVASAGDVNGDGFADVIVAASAGAYVYLGGPNLLSAALSTVLTGFAVSVTSVASAGDVNGDGYADVLVGDGNSSLLSGSAYIYLGSAAGVVPVPATTLANPVEEDAMFGQSVASAGDVNGDGYADVVVGAPFELLGTGAAYVYLGGATGPALLPSFSLIYTPGDELGWSVASAGDVNGDGYSDVVVGSHANEVNVYLGSPMGLPSSPATALGREENTFGVAVFGASD